VAQAHQVAGTALIQLRALDLAHRALSVALDAADEAGNQHMGASAAATMCWLLLRQGRLSEAERLAVATADAIEPRFRGAPPEQLATWGWLMLRAAAAAVRDNRDDSATDMLNAAAAAASALGDRPPAVALSPGPAAVGAFCAATVAMKRVEAAVIAGDTARALVLAGQVPDDERPTSNNRNRHRLDVAYAQADQHSYSDATATLLGIRADAPAWLRHQRYARDIVGTIAAARKRAMSAELADLAELVGVEP